MRDTDSMPKSFTRTPIPIEQLQQEYVIVAYLGDDELQNQEPALHGAFELRSSNISPGSWNVGYRESWGETDGLINLSTYKHVFRVWGDHQAIGHRGPWR